MGKTKGLIATGHPATAEAAAIALRAGGNAFDAAISAFMASFIAEPGMSSVGGGAFLAACKNDGTALIYDFFVQTPQHKRPIEEIEFLPVELDFGTAKETFHVGMGSVGVPGSVAGIFKMHSDLASLPMGILAEPAIELARKGVVVDHSQDHDFHLLEPILALSKSSPVFWRNGQLLGEGDMMYMPELAECLEMLIREGADAFYQGEVGKHLLAINKEKGGHLTQKDLSEYRVSIHKPLEFFFRDRRIVTNPLPSLGGSLIAIALKLLETKGSVNYAPSGREHVERLMEVCSVLDTIPRTPGGLAKELARWFPDSDSPVKTHSTKIGGTSHISIMDGDGNAAAISTSNGEGCGHFIPNTGIFLNNMLGESALLPGGIHSWEENVRLGSMMSPTVVFDHKGRTEMVLGSGGAGRIPSMIAQVIHYVVDHGLEITEAVSAPRLHWIDGVCNLEPGLCKEVRAPRSLIKMLPWEKQSLYFGGVHAILRRGETMDGEGDRRRGGVILRVD
ncbi:MAG: gamma-glutamyltransferase [SAR324 cluster bacterium]|nr:gamma-glutamyltransferase [SAR324 cluster bacterium]